MSSRHELRRGLERYGRRWLSEAQAEALLAETEAHLDVSIQARLELGDSAAVAERGAVEAFGSPRQIVGRLVEIRRARFQTLFLGLTTVGALGAAFAVLASPVLGSRLVTVTWIAFTAMFGGFVESSKHRRPWRPVLVAVVAFWLAFSAMCALWLRDFSIEGWLQPRQNGPVDPVHAAGWGATGALVYLGYLVLAYRMARPGSVRRRE